MRRRNWLDVAESGGFLGVWLLVVLCAVLGRAGARVVLWPVALYYAAVHRTARESSRDWWRRVTGEPRVGFRTVFRHLLRFSQVALDRVFLRRRQFARFDLRPHGREAMQRIRDSKRGVMFLSAHLGSFEAMQVLAGQASIPVHFVGYFRNARAVNDVLSRLDPSSNARFIEADPASPEFVFAIRDRLEAGEHVAILGDRVGLGGPSAEVEFMGGRARLPLGPYLLASSIGCPVCLVFGLYRDPNRYDVHFEWFADRIAIPRAARVEVATEHARRFADRLADYARRAPDNWFNFFDFWTDDDTATRDAGITPARRRSR